MVKIFLHISQAYLCHESCQENGSIIEAAGGWAGKCTIVRGNGALLRSRLDEGVTIESVRDKWTQITDLTDAKKIDTIGEASGALMTSLEGLRNGQGDQSPGDEYEFTNRETILYALGGRCLHFQFITEIVCSYRFKNILRVLSYLS